MRKLWLGPMLPKEILSDARLQAVVCAAVPLESVTGTSLAVSGRVSWGVTRC
jgi:hypothetical protein